MPGLPAHGLLQFFHDLESYGNQESDRDAWLVRWVPRCEDSHRPWQPTITPSDLQPERLCPPVTLAHEVARTIPVPSTSTCRPGQGAQLPAV